MIHKIKISSLFIFLIVALFTATAQVGIKGGIGVSDIVFADEGQSPYLGYEVDYLEHRNPLVSFQVGGFANFWQKKRFDLQPELLFVHQGLNYNIDFLYANYIYKVNIYYLQVPVLVRYKFLKEKSWHPGLYIGPYGALKLNAVKVTGENGEKMKEDMQNVNNGDFGIVFGINFDIDLPLGQFVVDLRSGYSLINMMQPIEGYIPRYYGPEKERARNVSITIMIGYRFTNIWNNKTINKTE